MESCIAEVDGVADKGSGDTATTDVQTLLKAFLNMSQDLLLSLIKLFSNKEVNF